MPRQTENREKPNTFIELNITLKKDANLQRTMSGKRQEYLSALQQETQYHAKCLFTFNKFAFVSHPETLQIYFQAKLVIFMDII